MIDFFLNMLLHLDQHIVTLVHDFGLWTYLILFLIIFCETGLVVTPFFPGDSLLFAVGSVAAISNLNILWLYILLITASILGDSVNYSIGRFVGPKVFHKKKSVFFNPDYLKKAHEFYERHGGQTILIGKFMPIIRTFAPFVAGVAKMERRHFSLFVVLSAVLWVGGILTLSYCFGQVSFVKQHYSYVVLGIIIVSILPAGVKLLQASIERQSS